MVRDQNTPTSNKLFYLVALASIIVIVTVMLMYLSTRQHSFAKIQPYNIEIKLNALSSKQLIAEYDYGYGYNAGHQQIFELTSNQSQTIKFTISAWKKIKSLRINSDGEVSLESLVVKKNNAEYQPVKSITVVTQESPLLLSYIDHNLLGMNN